MDTSPPLSPASHPHSSTSSPPPTLTAAHHDSRCHECISRNSFCEDSAVLIAATQLLELSKRQILNGVVKPHDFYRPEKREECSLTTTTTSYGDEVTELVNGEREEDSVDRGSPLGKTAIGEMSKREEEGDREGDVVVEGKVNGCSESVREDGEREGGRQGDTPDCAVERMEVEGDGDVENGEVVTGVDGDGVKGEKGGGGGRVEVNSEEFTSEEMMEDVFGKFTIYLLTVTPSHPPLQLLTFLSWTLAWCSC